MDALAAAVSLAVSLGLFPLLHVIRTLHQLLSSRRSFPVNPLHLSLWDHWVVWGCLSLSHTGSAGPLLALSLSLLPGVGLWEKKTCFVDCLWRHSGQKVQSDFFGVWRGWGHLARLEAGMLPGTYNIRVELDGIREVVSVPRLP